MSDSGRTAGITFPNKRPLFYYITDRSQLGKKSLSLVLRRVIAAGVDFVQIREKDLPDRQLFELSARCVALAQGTECKVLVNGRADVALAAGAHGVHLPSRGLRPGDLGRCLPDGFLVGVSVHSIREARQAQREGADYVLLGPIFATPSKLALGNPLGLSYLKLACRSVRLPVLALGGMQLESFEQVLAAGAAGVAGISLFQKNTGTLEGMRKIQRSPRNSRIHFFPKKMETILKISTP